MTAVGLLLAPSRNGRGRLPGMARPETLPSFLWREIHHRGISQRQLALEAGISPASICRYLRGSRPTEKNFERLRAALGPNLPPIRTETDRRREQALENLKQYGHLAHTPEAKRRAVDARTGKPRPRMAVAGRERWRREREAGKVRPNAFLTEYVKSPTGRAMVSLGKFLDNTPKPTRDQLSRWASTVATRLGLTEETVLAMWRPGLRDRGLQREGRPPQEDRHRVVQALRDTWPRTGSGTLKPGFWKTAVVEVRKAERTAEGTGSRITAAGLRAWYPAHVKACGGSARHAGSARPRRRTQARAEVGAEARAKVRRQLAAGDWASLPPELTFGQVARFLGISGTALRNLTESGQIAAVRTQGGWRRYRVEDVVHAEEIAYLTTGQVARELGVHPGTVKRWEATGRLEGVRTSGGRRRFTRATLERALAEYQRRVPTARRLERPSRAAADAAAAAGDWARLPPELTVGQVAALLGISPTAVRNLTHSGEIHARRTAAGWRRYKVADVRAFMEERGDRWLTSKGEDRSAGSPATADRTAASARRCSAGASTPSSS